MEEILAEIPHLSTFGINTDANSHYMQDREADFLSELRGIELALVFLKKCSPRLASEKKYHVGSYTPKHAMENPSGQKFLDSVSNGVAILAEKIMGFEVPLHEIAPYVNIIVIFVRDLDI